jgi:HEAT repeat protein
MSTPANDTGTAKDDGKCPYKGLRPYEESDKDNFFGRDGETRILTDKLLSRKLTLLFAASGIGKSSLLQAALLPALEHPEPPGHDALDVVYCNDWVKEPGVTLKTKVVEELRRRDKIPQDYPLPLDAPLAPFLRRCTLFSSAPLVLILDQFEEFFNYQRHRPEFRPFIHELSAAIRDDASATRFLLSMREDFALELNAFKPELPTLLFDNYFRLEALSRDNAKTVILAPLKRVDCDCEAALLEALLNDLGKYDQQPDSGSQPGGRLLELPPARIEPAQIQIICTQLWEKEHADDSRQLRQSTYQSMGGTDGLLKRYFEAKVAPLSTGQQDLASRAFDFLVSSQGTKMAYPLYELLKRTGVRNANAFALVLEDLEKARVLRRQERLETKSDRTEWEPYYELYHDLFAKPVNDWNREYKISRAQRRTLFGVAGAAAGALLLYAAWNIVYQRTHDHLRLPPPAGLSDRIELWSGTHHDFDLIGQRTFRAETRLLRNEVAPDQQLEHAPVGDYDQLNIELIGLMSLIERIDAYREAGFDEQGLKLLTQTLIGRDRDASAKAMFRLARFRNPDTGAAVEYFLRDESDPKRREQLVVEWRELPTTHALRLLEHASRDKAPGVRRQVAAMLGGLAGKPGGEQAVAPLVALLKDPDPVVRGSAPYTLRGFAGQPGGEQAVASLVALLKDPDPVVRRSAASVLGAFAGQTGGEQAVAPLVALLKDPVPVVRRSAAYALGGFAGQPGGEQAVASLVALLKDPDPVVRVSAPYALRGFAGQPGGEQAVALLVALLKDPDSDVRDSAAHALRGFAGQPGGEQAVAPLVALLKDPDPDVRDSAADALRGFAGQPGGEQAVALLVALLKDPDSDVRRSAAYALGGFAGQPGGEQAVAPLVALLKDPDVHRSAASALPGFARQPGGEQAVAPLVALLKDPDSDVRDSTAHALRGFAGQPGGEQAVAPLVALLKDPDPDVGHSAAYALGGFAGQPGGEQAVALLVALLKDPDPDVRRSAAYALGGFAGQPGGEQAVAPLLALLKDPDPDVGHSAASALRGFVGQPGGEQAVAPLVELLKDPDRDVRGSAASVLGGFAGQPGGEQAIAPLVELLKVGDVPFSAVRALGGLAGQPGGEQAVAPLVARLKDPDRDVRRSAASVLGAFAGQTGGEQAVAPLVALLREPDRHVRRSAASALRGFVGQPGGEQAVAPLVELLKDPDRDVRGSAADALGDFAGQPGGEQAIAPLVELLKVGDVPFSAVRALGGFAGQPGGEQAVAPLVELLKDPDRDVRGRAAGGLNRFAGRLDLKSTTASLRHLAESGTGASSFPARMALALMNPDQPVFGAPHQGAIVAKPAPNHTVDAEASMRDKNAALLMSDIEALSDEARNTFLPELARFPSPLILTKLLELETRTSKTHDPTAIAPLQSVAGDERETRESHRAAALLALGKTRDPTAIARLQAVAGDGRETHPMRVAAIRALGYTESDPVAGFLVELIAKNPSLANPIYSALDNIASKTALPFMERGLSAQRERRQDWRKHRATWREAFNDPKLLDKDPELSQTKDEWEDKLKALQPNEPLETWFARQIARLDEQRAKELLRDPTYAIRRGAWIGFAQSGDAERVRWLIDRHAKENNPLYRFALYRAIDRLLQRLEVVGDTNDLARLQSLQKEWTEKLAKDRTPKPEWSTQRRVQKTILQRIDWTIPVIADVLEFRKRLQAAAVPRSAEIRVESNKPEG